MAGQNEIEEGDALMIREVSQKKLAGFEDDLRYDRIIHFATIAFLNQGYDCTSVDDIAVSARVSKRTIYEHFVSKENIFRAVIRTATDNVVEMLRMEFDVDASVEDTLTEFCAKYIRAMISPIVAGRPFYELNRIIIGASLQFPEIHRVVNDYYIRVSKGLYDYIKEINKIGKLSDLDDRSCATYFYQVAFYNEEAILFADSVPKFEDIENLSRKRVRVFLYGCTRM